MGATRVSGGERFQIVPKGVRVTNVHERALGASAAIAGELIDRLASEHDVLWPLDRWPPMRFDRSLGVGADGGHGPIRYVVEAYEPGRSIRFRFTRPKGFIKLHFFEYSLPANKIRRSEVHFISIEYHFLWLVSGAHLCCSK